MRSVSRRSWSLGAVIPVAEHLDDDGRADEAEVDAHELISGAGVSTCCVAGTGNPAEGDQSQVLVLEPTVATPDRLGALDRFDEPWNSEPPLRTQCNDPTMHERFVELSVSQTGVEGQR